MKKHTVATFLAVLAASAAAAGPTLADDDNRCGRTDRSKWLPIEAIAENAREMGYEPREIERDDGCYKVETRTDGKELEVYFHPVTGAIVGVDDDD